MFDPALSLYDRAQDYAEVGDLILAEAFFLAAERTEEATDLLIPAAFAQSGPAPSIFPN